MLPVQSVIGCRLTFDKLLRSELRGGLRAKLLRGGAVRAKLLRGGAVRAAGQVTAGRAGGLRAMVWQHLRLRAKLLRGGLRARR